MKLIKTNIDSDTIKTILFARYISYNYPNQVISVLDIRNENSSVWWSNMYKEFIIKELPRLIENGTYDLLKNNKI